MPLLETDFSSVPDSIPLIDVGQYRGTISSMTFEPARGQGKPYIKVQLKITEGPMTGKVAFDEFVTEWIKDPTSSHAVRFGNLLSSAGLTTEQKKSVNTDELIGKSVEFIIGHSTYVKDGVTKEKAEVKSYVFTATPR